LEKSYKTAAALVGSVAERVKKASFFYGDRVITIVIGHVVAPLDKALYDDYLCLVASNKQQIKW